LYHTSVGATLDSDAVSTTGSGCFLPSFTAQQFNRSDDTQKQRTVSLISKVTCIFKCHPEICRNEYVKESMSIHLYLCVTNAPSDHF
jgi:hypothetical protein